MLIIGWRQVVLVLVLAVSAAAAQEPQIIDFTYTHVLQEGAAASDLAEKIIIFPDTKQIEKYSFPEICDLKDKLDEGVDHSSTAADAIDVDEHLKGLRAKIVHLLRLSEEMKNIKAGLAGKDEVTQRSRRTTSRRWRASTRPTSVRI